MEKTALESWNPVCFHLETVDMNRIDWKSKNDVLEEFSCLYGILHVINYDFSIVVYDVKVFSPNINSFPNVIFCASSYIGGTYI